MLNFGGQNQLLCDIKWREYFEACRLRPLAGDCLGLGQRIVVDFQCLSFPNAESVQVNVKGRRVKAESAPCSSPYYSKHRAWRYAL